MAQIILWIFTGLTAGLGLLGLLVPEGLGRIQRLFLSKTPLRLIGVLLMASGALTFRAAYQEELPLFVYAAGVVLFMVGGVELFLPSAIVILNEWWLSRSNAWQRLAGLGWLVLAALFFLTVWTLPVLEGTAAPPVS
jgi:hypothetical protein